MCDALIQFLLARITEDGELLEYGVWSPAREYAHEESARWRAECEAKRRIVEGHSRDSHWCPMGDGALRVLATVYAEHPDFRPEWRV